ncbi:polysaccharide deacetylase family protein [Polyangium jinanense]|uniref:Polysaccharide deacetylase family protein n=1 Tax=Polyangium jinanense TaxID=2829994 RepID=A0A9X3X0F0_9BACT|nr:polysaccharide deacetylase family protein [Polyangium jinanense]MDC3953798.1 polysaccharide deacetylase family protein [Polyangium jinanense]MDC3979081.1 polysaccharide deacetylase family protein [Polyangium jinanense]
MGHGHFAESVLNYITSMYLDPVRPTAWPSKRARLARALDTLGILDRLLSMRTKLATRSLMVLTYHRIADAAAVGELDADVRETDARGLAEQIKVVKQHGAFVSLPDVRRFLRGGPLPANAVMLAFDDGYRDCHDVALPILKKAGATATFFVPTAFPDAGRMFWWDRIALLLRRCQKRTLVLTYPRPIVLDLGRDPAAAKRFLLGLVKRTPGLDLARFFEELSRAVDVTLDPAEERSIATRTIMSFREVRALADAGMSVASHSHEHRVIATMTPDEALSDLGRSRRVLSDVLEEDVRTVAYPVGHQVQGPFLRVARDAGFDLGFTNATGFCMRDRADPLNVPRIAMGPEFEGPLFKALMIARP